MYFLRILCELRPIIMRKTVRFQEQRARYNKENYIQVFADRSAAGSLITSEEEPSLCDLVQRWLERTPGLEESGFNFWAKYEAAVSQLLQVEQKAAQVTNKKPFSKNKTRTWFLVFFQKKCAQNEDLFLLLLI
jgi:hypothetical protein